MTEQPEQKDSREKIIAASLEEFATHGLSGARVDRIAKQAGLNKAMLYYHFNSKKDLFLAVIERMYEEIKKRHEAWMDADLSLDEKLTRAAGSFGGILSTSPNFPPLLLRALADRDEELLDRIAAIISSTGLPHKMPEVFEKASASGETREIDTRHAAMAFFAMNVGFHLFLPLFNRFWRIRDLEGFLEQWRTTAADIFLNGVKKEKG